MLYNARFLYVGYSFLNNLIRFFLSKNKTETGIVCPSKAYLNFLRCYLHIETLSVLYFFPPTGSQSKCRSFSRLVLERRSRRMVVGNSYHDNSGVRNRKLNNIPSCHLTWPIKLISSFLTTTKVTGIRSISNYIKLDTTESQIATRGFAVHKLIIIHDINMFCFISRLKFHL